MNTNKNICIALISSMALIFLSQQVYAAPTHATARWQDIESVVWSTDQATWGNEAVEVGDTLYFKFVMHKSELGRHYADLLKTWVDWDQDGQYEESESMFFSHLVSDANAGDSYDFYSTGFTLTSSQLGNIDLLTRVTCSESLLKSAGITQPWDFQWSVSMAQYNSYFKPDGYLGQGEFEYHTLTVTPSDSVDPIPEPTTMALFGVGLAVFAGIARRRR